MIGQQTQALEVRYHRLEIFNRWILALALIALVAVGALLAWPALQAAGRPDGEQVARDWMAATANADSAALDTVYATDAVVVTSWGSTYTGLDQIKEAMANGRAVGMSAEIIGPVVQNEDTIAVPVKLRIAGDDYYVTSILQLNGDGLIVRHEDYGTPG